MTGFRAWATAGDRIAFIATIHGRSGLWTQRFGAAQPSRLGPPACGKEEQTDELAAGPHGSWGCLERTVGNSSSFFSVDVISSRGVARHVASATGATSIPQIVGDGSYLGYLLVTSKKAVHLVQITAPGRRGRVATLAGAPVPKAAAVANGMLALLAVDGSVAVYTTTGNRLAQIKANAASIAVTANRIVVRARSRRLVVYGPRGGLVHSWPLAAMAWTAGLGSDGRYADYVGANKAVHVVRLSNGVDKILARAGKGWYFDGVSLDAPGAVVPLTTQQGRSFLVRLRFLPNAALKRSLG